MKCEVCKKNKSIGVVCVPGVPYSSAYCRECLEANAHPWDILVANTACCGSLDVMADWWKWMVTDTCDHLGRTLDDFLLSVSMSIQDRKGYNNETDDKGNKTCRC